MPSSSLQFLNMQAIQKNVARKLFIYLKELSRSRADWIPATWEPQNLTFLAELPQIQHNQQYAQNKIKVYPKE